MKNRVTAFIKKEAVLLAACALAVFSSFVVRPSARALFAAIDWRVLSLLFCLMITIQAFKSQNVLDVIASLVLRSCTTVRALYVAFVLLVFFSSMAVTNDVALLTFVPLTLLVCKKARIHATPLVVLETLAANLGSCVTPMGNPQNLYLYSFYAMSSREFFATTLKIGIPSLIMLVFSVLWETRISKIGGGAFGFDAPQKSTVHTSAVWIKSGFKTGVYCAVLVAVLLAVFRVIPYGIALALVCAVAALCDYRLFARVDYSLLATFAAFFVFTGNISSLEAVSDFLRSVQNTPLSAYITGIGVSEVISNVPAALLLSAFTVYPKELLLAVNVGGLGTLIASLASLISFKLFSADSDASANGDFMRVFTRYNVLYLIVLGVLVFLIA